MVHNLPWSLLDKESIAEWHKKVKNIISCLQKAGERSPKEGKFLPSLRGDSEELNSPCRRARAGVELPPKRKKIPNTFTKPLLLLHFYFDIASVLYLSE